MVHRHPVPTGPRSRRARTTPTPSGSAAFGRTAAALLALVLAAAASYTVQPGDTLSGIAVAHGTSSRALAEANGITDPDHIVAGRTLTIPGSPGAADGDATAGTVHVVQLGETLSGIAVGYGLRASEIAAANDIIDHNHVVAGRRLTIPGAAASAASGDGARVQTASAPAASASRAEVGALIDSAARAHGWNPAMVKAVAWQESGWSNTVISPAGAVGIMQVLPTTAAWVSTYLAGGRKLDLNDPADNVLVGVLFLDYLHGVTDGDVDMMLAGYYQGLASVERNGVFPSTRRYIANVRALRDRF